MQSKDSGARRQLDTPDTAEHTHSRHGDVSGSEYPAKQRIPRRRAPKRRRASDRSAIPSPNVSPEEGQHESSPTKNKGEDEDPVAFTGWSACPNPRYRRVDKRTGEVIGTVRCKGRYCPACGPRLRASHIAHFIEALVDLPALLFLTLTLDPKSLTDQSPSAYADVLIDTWSGFMKNLGERCGRAGVKRHYFGAVEGLRKGWPHIHAIVSCPLPDAESVIEQMWFRQGGGIIMDVSHVKGGDEKELAALVGYVLKEQFVPGVPRRNLLTSNGIGYNTQEARRRRREHADCDGDEIVLDPVRDVEPKPRRSPSKRRKASREELLDRGRRSRQCVHRREGTPFGVRARVSKSGHLHHDVVRIDWSPERSTPTYVTLYEDVGGSAQGNAVIDTLIEK